MPHFVNLQPSTIQYISFWITFIISIPFSFISTHFQSHSILTKMPHPSPVTASIELSATVKWSDCPHEEITEEARTEINPQDCFFDLSLKRLLAWQAELAEKNDSKSERGKKRRSLSIEIPLDQSIEMSWSSAATGKPQLSYAERLRRAKEGSRSMTSEDGIDGVTQDKGATEARGKEVESQKVSSISLLSGDASKTTSSDISPSLSSYGDTAATSSPAISSSGSPSLAPPSSVSSTLSTSISAPIPATHVNIWEARRLQLQEQSKKLQPSNSTVESETDQRSQIVEPNSTDYRKSDSSSARVNGQGSDKAQAYLEASIGRTEGSRPSSTEAKLEEKEKPGKASKKKKQQNQNNKVTQPPSISDASNWPSPNMAKEKVGRNVSPLMPSQDTKVRQSSTGENRLSADANRSSPSPLPNGSALEQLDIEVLHQPGHQEKRKGGKQWIPIVPTLTHSAPTATRPSQQQKRLGKNQNAVVGGNGKRVNSLSSGKHFSERRSSSGSQSIATKPRLQRNDEATQEKPARRGDQATEADSNSQKNAIASTRIENNSELQFVGQFPQFPPAQKVESGSGTDPTRTGQQIIGQRRKSGNRTPRGARGRGGSKRSSDSEANNANTSADTSQQGDTEPNPLNNLQTTGSGEQSFRSSRRDTLPNHRKPPSAPRFSNQANHLRRSTIQMINGIDQQYYDPHLQAMQFGGSHAPVFAGTSNIIHPHFAPPGSSFAPPFHGMQTSLMESTPVEFAPKGTSTNEEPTSALLWQIEFYFSHQNLQGDFFLRKVMDGQGFVPIERLAAFNRVKRLSGENVELIKDTVRFSKVLQLNEDASKVRKAFGWEPYILVEGQHAQQWQMPSASVPQSPYLGSPSHPSANIYPLPPIQFSSYGPTEMIGSSTLNGGMPMRNLPYPSFPPSMQYARMSSNEHVAPNSIGFAHQNENGVQVPNSQTTDSLTQSTEKVSISDGKTNNYRQNKEHTRQDDEEEEDSPLGVVAATGLGGTLRTTSKKEEA